MFAGRAAIAGYLAKKRQKNGSKAKSIFEQHQDKFKIKLKEPKLSYYYRPYGAWFLGLVFIAMSLFLVYVLQNHQFVNKIELTNEEIHQKMFEQIQQSNENNNTLINESITKETTVQASTWWRYLIAVFIMILGFSFMFCVSGRTAHFMKKNKLLVIEQINYMTCSENRKVYDLETIDNIQIIKKGFDTQNNSTVHYIIKIRLTTGENLKVAESGNKILIKKTFVEIMTYLERPIDFEGIEIQDLTSNPSTQQKAKPKAKEEPKPVQKEEKFIRRKTDQKPKKENVEYSRKKYMEEDDLSEDDYDDSVPLINKSSI